MTPILVWHTHFASYLLFVWLTRLKMCAGIHALEHLHRLDLSEVLTKPLRPRIYS
jgi:hypothetical protein